MKNKYKLSQGIEKLFEEAKKEPYKSINEKRGTSIDYFRQLIPLVDLSLQKFEQEIGITTTSSWQGKRLDECRKWGTSLRTFLADHLDGLYFANYDEEKNAAIIPLENYEFLDGGHLHCSTMPHYAIIRPAHIDVKKHIIQLGVVETSCKFQYNLEKILKRMKKSKSRKARETVTIGNSIQGYIKNLKLVYHSAADIVHSMASSYFEIEMLIKNPEIIRQFRIPIELPPSFEVTYLLNNIDPKAYKPFEGKCDAEQSEIEKNLSYIDLPKLQSECIESTKKHIEMLTAMRDLFRAGLDMNNRNFNRELFAESGKKINKALSSAGIYSPFMFLDEHIKKRKKK